MDDKNISPVGWYVATYLIRFIELEHDNNDDPEERYLTWENTIIIKAPNLAEAYDKVVEHSSLETKPYEGGDERVPVQWVFEGVTELLPIFEDLEDGSEIMFREHTRTKLKTLRKAIREKNDFYQ